MVGGRRRRGEERSAGNKSLVNGSDGGWCCAAAASKQRHSCIHPFLYVRHKVFIPNSCVFLHPPQIIIFIINYVCLQLSVTCYLKRNMSLTTHSFRSGSYLSPLFGYTSIGLLVTFTHQCKTFSISLPTHSKKKKRLPIQSQAPLQSPKQGPL